MKIVLILPAYNAQKSLRPFLKSLPKDVFDDIILVDDCSKDETYKLARSIRGLKVYKTKYNLGYGGNLKTCLSIAMEQGADLMVELHPDAEYGTDGIQPSIEEVKRGANLVLGNRFTSGIPQGMFWWKYIISRFLSKIGNAILGTNIPDLHQGFRVYTRDLLEKVSYRQTSNNYLFSFEIIAQAVFKKLPIASVPVKALYKGKKRGASLRASIAYTLWTLWVCFLFLRAKQGSTLPLFRKPTKIPICVFCEVDYYMQRRENQKKFTIFYCQQCEVGMTSPMPQNLDSYYSEAYWNPKGVMGILRSIAFRIFQRRRRTALTEYVKRGNVLDVGSGEGEFGKSLSDKYKVINLDLPNSAINNPDVIKKDFLSWKTQKRFDSIVFWESLEHVPDPKKYLKKTALLLKSQGYLYIEYPRYQSLESRFFGKHWFHLDMPRHTFHFTDSGMKKLLTNLQLQIISDTRILALEYTPWGFFASVLSIFGYSDMIIRQQGPFLIKLILLPVLFASFLVELLLFTLNQSPIRMIVVRHGK